MFLLTFEYDHISVSGNLNETEGSTMDFTYCDFFCLLNSWVLNENLLLYDLTSSENKIGSSLS